MTDKGYVVIDSVPVEIDGEKNLLELIRKAGIELPTFCYHSELSIHGACRMCMVETKKGSLAAACSEPPRDGMEIRTNTTRLRKYRRNILELLLANHCRDCTTCDCNGACKLQDLASRFGIDQVRFPNHHPVPEPDDSSLCVRKDAAKCILCGDCVRMCSEVQQVGAIDFAHRGSRMTISTSFGIPLADSTCVGCGQCAAVCPTGAITVRDDRESLWRELDNPDTLVTVQIAPAVRVAVGEAFGLENSTNAVGLIAAALRRLGFAEVYDTACGADLVIVEEAKELLERLEKNTDLPLFTSCCPAWVNFCQKFHPDFLPHLSTCRSPMQMLASVLKEQYQKVYRQVVHVAVMPCTAKKYEAARLEFRRDGKPLVDYVITTQELIRMIREAGVVFQELAAEGMDPAFGEQSGAGMIFGVTGGVTEAVLRRLSSDRTPGVLRRLALSGTRGNANRKEATLAHAGRELHIAMVSGLGEADRLVREIKSGQAKYDFVEVMACPGGCVLGAGQPVATAGRRQGRGEGLYTADRLASIRRAEDNPLLLGLYRGILKNRTHELLHVSYPSQER
jgi:NADH-quinone oxidoreductase subunit G